MTKHSVFYALPLLMVLAAPFALAQPAPGTAKEQRQSSTPKKMPDKSSADARRIKQGQQEAKDQHNRKMQGADAALATGIASGSQGMGSGMTQPKKSSPPGNTAKSANKPAVQPQSGALKK
jgi:hypothetical protein